MNNIWINGKALPIPSFFQVMNYGGGFQDKTREVVYADLTGEVPLLLNYFYINNHYPYGFHSRYFDNIEAYDTIGNLFNEIREKMIRLDGNVMASYPRKKYDFNQRVILLDSGASNIVKLIAEETHYDKELFRERLLEDMTAYYNFAHQYKFDIVVGFDLGGKYTFKAGETKDERLIRFYDSIDKDEINYWLTKKAVEYLKVKSDYYPKVLAAVHGKTPEEYKNHMEKIILLEKNSGYSFWGFALGGIASSKGMSAAWYENIDFKGTNRRHMKNAVTPARAAKIVRELAGERPVHALGCGGFINIPMNYYSGATSFDAASPSRRVGDGNDLSVEFLYSDIKPLKAKFSKVLLGGYNAEFKKMKTDFDYYKICDVDDDYELCGCAACQYVESVSKLKELYGKKKTDPEAHYLARQIMNAHSVNAHALLCELVAQYTDMDTFVKEHSYKLNKELIRIFKQL